MKSSTSFNPDGRVLPQEHNLLLRILSPTAVVFGPDAVFDLSKEEIPTLSKGNPSPENYKIAISNNDGLITLYIIYT